MDTVITVNQVSKRYGSVTAVDGISLDVQAQEIFAIVGPNGAGKTTLVESMMGLRCPDSGEIRVLGLDPQQDGDALRRRIGIQLQEAALPERIKVWEALDLFASFYAKTVNWEQLLQDWGLAEKRNALFGKLSGGQKQRLFICLALLNDPELVFLDELTTGLDPQARRATWDAVRAICARGKTVVLVTHFMDEAQALADRVAIVDRGHLVALDTPERLIAGLDKARRVTFSHGNGFVPATLAGLPGVAEVVENGRTVTVYGRGPLAIHVAAALKEHGLYPEDLRVEQANLEDVFLAYTGYQMRES